MVRRCRCGRGDEEATAGGDRWWQGRLTEQKMGERKGLWFLIGRMGAERRETNLGFGGLSIFEN